MRAAALPPIDLVPAAEATARLKVSRASLYAYVSRGQIRSFASPHDPRQRLYSADDIEALLKRRVRLRRPAAAAATALDWGLPVLETGITQIKGGRLFYRGVDAVALAERASLEETAALLMGVSDADPFRLPPPVPAADLEKPAEGSGAFVGRAVRLLSELGAGEREGVAAAILRLVTAAATGQPPSAERIHHQLACAWDLGEDGREALRRALVLCADHELSASAFAVRVVASTGAALPACIIAGLTALSGVRHGGATDAVRTLLESYEASGPAWFETELATRNLGAAFGHPLYPEGDPRAAAILARLPLRHSDAGLWRAVAGAAGQAPSLDFGLVAMERAFELPQGAAFAVFAIGRTAGWLAHALEQGAQQALIRPRARYVVATDDAAVGGARCSA